MHACMHGGLLDTRSSIYGGLSTAQIVIVDVMFRIYIARIRIYVLREWKSACGHVRVCMGWMGW